MYAAAVTVDRGQARLKIKLHFVKTNKTRRWELLFICVWAAEDVAVTQSFKQKHSLLLLLETSSWTHFWILFPRAGFKVRLLSHGLYQRIFFSSCIFMTSAEQFIIVQTNPVDLLCPSTCKSLSFIRLRQSHLSGTNLCVCFHVEWSPAGRMRSSEEVHPATRRHGQFFNLKYVDYVVLLPIPHEASARTVRTKSAASGSVWMTIQGSYLTSGGKKISQEEDYRSSCRSISITNLCLCSVCQLLRFFLLSSLCYLPLFLLFFPSLPSFSLLRSPRFSLFFSDSFQFPSFSLWLQIHCKNKRLKFNL